ncbi:MAG: PEP-CTERM sorting domain-containing protein [Symploca sp. SIO2C1]|nr:PEP-CTERM sorting domain-containing protein [Symploca sp. SIO2C1]
MKRAQLARLVGVSTSLTFSFGISTAAQAFQLVYLDFDSQTDPSEIQYTSEQRNAILSNLDIDYALFDVDFTLIQPSSSLFSTLFFNDGPSFGLAEQIDFRNLDKDDTVTININGAGATTSDEIVGLTSSTAAHELGHILGLRHGDAFGPIGSGIDEIIANSTNYSPAYLGPTNVTTEPRLKNMDIPFLPNLANEANKFFSERSAIKLAFNDHGTVVSESGGNNSIATAQALTLASLDVPNPLLSGINFGREFIVDALTVTGSINAAGEGDFFSFTGNAGDLFNFEVISDVLDRIANPIDSQISIFDSRGNFVDYFGTNAFNDNEFETNDSIIIDLVLPADDTYFINVNAASASDTGDYELFFYRFATDEVEINGTSSATFVDLQPASSASVFAGEGTSTINWGVPVSGSTSSQLSFTGNPFSTSFGEPFVAGTLEYTNGIISGSPSDTGITGANLRLNSIIDVPGLAIDDRMLTIERSIETVSTPNTSDPDESADILTIMPPAGLGSGFGNNFHVFEGDTATATLIGRIIESEVRNFSFSSFSELELDTDQDSVFNFDVDLDTVEVGQPVQLPQRVFAFEILGFGEVTSGEGFITSTSVPEPSTLLGTGLAIGLGSLLKKRKQTKK